MNDLWPRSFTRTMFYIGLQDGTFTLNLKPQEPGKHQLSIQYGGVHVQGSPYTVRVSGAPDPTRVRVYGPGVEHGVLAMYQSRFICDTRGAGAGQLTVRIRGPKGTQIHFFKTSWHRYSFPQIRGRLIIGTLHALI